MRSGEPLDPGSAMPAILVASPPDAASVEVPNGSFLLTAEFERQGDDLLLRAPDEGPAGPDILVRDYFAGATPPDLVTGTGATIDGELAARLAGPLAPAQYAQAQLAQTQLAQTQLAQSTDGGAEPVGEVTELSGSVLVTRTSGVQQPLSLGDPVFLGDILQTGPDTSVGIRFVDDTLFSLSSNARLVIDQVIYNPEGADNALSLSLVQGAFAFVSGGIAPADGPGMSIRTPVATIGVRGTTGAGEFLAAVQRLVVSLLEGLDGDLGAIDVYNSVSLQTLAGLLDTLTVTSATETLPPPSQATADQLAIYSLALSSLSRSYLDLIQEITPEAGPEQEGGSGGSGGAILASFLAQAEIVVRVAALDESGEPAEFNVEVDEDSLADILAQNPNLILLLQLLAELDLANLTVIADLDNTAGGGATIDGITDFVTQFVEDSAAIPIVGNISIVSVSGTVESAVVTLQAPFDAASESLSLVDAGQLPAGITLDPSSTATTLILTGLASTEDYEDALALVRYLNTADNPGDRLITVEIDDGTSSFTATTTIDGAFGVLVVGSDQNDQDGSAAAHAIAHPEGPNSGAVIGDVLDDVLIGDSGTTRPTTVNLVLAIDTSGSMLNRLALAQAALENLLNDYADLVAQGVTVNLQVIPFANNPVDPGDIGAFELAAAGGLADAVAFIDQLVAIGGTNYPVAFNAIQAALGGIAPADLNTVYFVSDGTAGNPAAAIAAFNAFVADYISDGGAFDPAANLDVHAIGIDVDQAVLDFMSQFDNTGGAENVEVAAGLTAETVSITQPLAPGNDVLIGESGDDVIFGDVINTDDLASAEFGAAGTHDGAGFDALVAFLTDSAAGVAPTPGQIAAYIRANAASLIDDDEAQGGDDLLRGGEGDDLLVGGGGQDSFVFSLAEASGNDIIADFTLGAGGDTLRLDDVFDYDGGGVTVVDLDSAAAAADGWAIADDGTDVIITLGSSVANDQNGGQITLEGIGNGSLTTFAAFDAAANLDVNA